MVVPLPAVHIQSSQKALEYRNILFALSLTICIHSFLTIFLMRHLLDGFFTGIIGGIGFYVIRNQDIDYGCLPLWGMFSAFNGVINFVTLLDHAVNMPPGIHYFSGENGGLVNFIRFMAVVGELAKIAVAYCVYCIYKVGNEPASGNSGYEVRAPPGHGRTVGGSGLSGYGSMTGVASGGSVVSGGAPGAAAGRFQPFEGRGNQLGGAN